MTLGLIHLDKFRGTEQSTTRGGASGAFRCQSLRSQVRGLIDLNNKARSAVVGLIVAVLSAAGTGAAHASEPATSNTSGTVSSSSALGSNALGSAVFLSASEYTYAEVLAAVKDSPYVTVMPARVLTPGLMSTKGVNFGVYVYVRVTQTVARALMSASGVTAVGLLGLSTGGIGMVIAGAVVAYVVSIGSDALNACARWEFQINYSGTLHNAFCY